MKKPNWQIQAEKSIRRMTRKVKPLRIEYFDWNQYREGIITKAYQKKKL